MEHKKEPTAASRPDCIGHRIRYSHISRSIGVATACRKSEQGNIRDHNLRRSNVFKLGKLLFPVSSKRPHNKDGRLMTTKPISSLKKNGLRNLEL